MITNITKYEKQREQWWKNDPNWRNDPYQQVGYFPLRNDITVLPADNPDKLRLGWTIYEEVGIVIVNDYAINRIQITSINVAKLILGKKYTLKHKSRSLTYKNYTYLPQTCYQGKCFIINEDYIGIYNNNVRMNPEDMNLRDFDIDIPKPFKWTKWLPWSK